MSLNTQLEMVKNEPDIAILKKKDKNAIWPNHDCSNDTLLNYLDRGDEIDRARFLDIDGIGDGIEIHFKQKPIYMNPIDELVQLALNNKVFIADMEADDHDFELPDLHDPEETMPFTMMYYGWLVGSKNTTDLKQFKDVIEEAATYI